jgi:hypothetical protein
MGSSVGIISKEVIPIEENDPHWRGLPEWCGMSVGQGQLRYGTCNPSLLKQGLADFWEFRGIEV